MGLIEFVKTVLGLESTQRERGGQPREGASSGRDVAVTVEHEPDTAAEDAVKGTDSTANAAEERAEDVTDGEQASPDDEPPVDASAKPSEAEQPGQDQAEQPGQDQAEDTGEATESETTDEKTRAEAPSQPAAGEESEPGAESETEMSGAGTEDVQSIKGIGPAYADRLAQAGIYTVADLVAADIETVAEDTGVAESRVSTWMERASD